MSSPRPPFVKAVAVKSLELAIRFWPSESRHWGQALLAEAHEIADPIEAFFWALGGVAVFLRSHLSHLFALLKLPPGRTTSPLPVGANGPRFPRNSRLVTTLILLAVAFVLLLPAGREATSIVSASWRDFQATPSETRVIERLAAKAEKDRDAHQLAFLANCEPDPDLSEKFANRAVELDLSLFWIYASRYRRPDDVVNQQWLQRLRSSDPDNAFVYILTAQAAVNPIVWSKLGPNDPSSAEVSQVPGYSDWITNMDRAFRSPRYDSYATRHAELTQQGWAQSPQVPLSLVTYSLWSSLILDMGSVQRFVDLRIRDAQSAAAVGHFQHAEDTLRQLASFGQRMLDGSQDDFERLKALEIARSGQEALAKFYAHSGRPVDAQLAAAQVHSLEAGKDNMLRAWQESRQPFQEHFKRRAAIVQTSALSALTLTALTFIALLLLEIRAIPWRSFPRLRWLACRAADIGPAAVLLLAATFLLSFRPFARALEQYRAKSPVSAATPDFTWQLFQLSFVRPVRYFFQPSGEAALWLFLTVALCLIAAAIIFRAIWRRFAHAHHA